MISSKIAKQTLFALVLSLLALPAFAADAAIILFTHGAVTVSNAKGSHALKKGEAINAGDTINTGADGRIQMRFSDGGLVSLKPNSSFAVDKYNQPTGKTEGSLAFNLIKGGLRTLSGTIGHQDHDNYQLKTSVATLGIRGTQFIVTMDGETMRVHVGHGEVSLYNQFGQLLVSSGQNGQVNVGQAPELSLIVPQFGKNNDSGDKSKDDTDQRQRWLAFLMKNNIALAVLMGKQGTFYSSGISVAGVSSLYYPQLELLSSQPDQPKSFSLSGLQLSVIKLIAENNGVDTSGWFSALNDGDLASVQQNPPTVNVTGGLVWGEVPVTAPTTSEGYVPSAPTMYNAYVIGTPATDLPLTGTLSYSLAGSTPVRGSDGSQAATGLSQFDLNINLGVNTTFEVAMTTNNTSTAQTFSNMGNPVSGNWQTNGPATFSFTAPAGSDLNVNDNCGSCSMDVAGLLSGKAGAQAGVTYRMTGTGGAPAYTGAAVLNKQSMPVAGL